MTQVEPRPKSGRKKPYASTIQNKRVATDMHARIVRARGYCEVGELLRPLLPRHMWECEGELQCCHIIRRSRSATRTDLTNALAGCKRHHAWFDSHLADLMIAVGPDVYQRLQRKADAGIQGSGLTPLQFWRKERLELTELARRMGLT